MIKNIKVDLLADVHFLTFVHCHCWLKCRSRYCIHIGECVHAWTVNSKKITANSDVNSVVFGNLLSTAHNFGQIEFSIFQMPRHNFQDLCASRTCVLGKFALPWNVVVSFVVSKVIYLVNNTTYIINQYNKFGDMFWFTEPSSGQFIQQSKGTFSECANYGIPYRLQIILTVKIILNSFGWCIIWNIYKNSCQYIFVKIFKIMVACVYITSKTLVLSDGVVCLWSLPILSLVHCILNSGELLTSIF